MKRFLVALCLVAALCPAASAQFTPPPDLGFYPGTYHIYAVGCTHYATALGQGPNGQARTDSMFAYAGADTACAGFINVGDCSWDSYHTSESYTALMDHFFAQIRTIGVPWFPTIGNHEVSRYLDGTKPAGTTVAADSVVNDGTLYNEFAAAFPRFFAPYTSAAHPGRRSYGVRLRFKGYKTHTLIVDLNTNREEVNDTLTAYTENNPDGYGQADDDFDGASDWNSPMRKGVREFLQREMGTGDRLIVVTHRALETGIDSWSLGSSARPAISDAWGPSGWAAEIDTLAGGRWICVQADTHEDLCLTRTDGAGYILQSTVALRNAYADSLASLIGSVNWFAYKDSVYSAAGALADSLGANCDNCGNDPYVNFSLLTELDCNGSAITAKALLFKDGDPVPTVVDSVAMPQ